MTRRQVPSRCTSPVGPRQAVACGGAGRDQAGVPGLWKFLELMPLLRQRSACPLSPGAELAADGTGSSALRFPLGARVLCCSAMPVVWETSGPCASRPASKATGKGSRPACSVQHTVLGTRPRLAQDGAQRGSSQECPSLRFTGAHLQPPPSSPGAAASAGGGWGARGHSAQLALSQATLLFAKRLFAPLL